MKITSINGFSIGDRVYNDGQIDCYGVWEIEYFNIRFDEGELNVEAQGTCCKDQPGASSRQACDISSPKFHKVNV